MQLPLNFESEFPPISKLPSWPGRVKSRGEKVASHIRKNKNIKVIHKSLLNNSLYVSKFSINKVSSKVSLEKNSPITLEASKELSPFLARRNKYIKVIYLIFFYLVLDLTKLKDKHRWLEFCFN